MLEKPEIKALAVELNTIDQLYEQGVDSSGISLGPYSKNNPKSLTHKHVDLKLTGEFYGTFKAETKVPGELDITANPIKDDKDLTEVYGPIIGLTDESVGILGNSVRVYMPNELRKELKI